MVERVESESFWLFRPDLADVLIRGEALECLEALCKVVGADEVAKMSAKLVVGFVLEALDGRALDGAVHALDLPVGPGIPRLGEAMI